MRHIVALSGGKDSTAMALILAEEEPRDYEYVITPTGDEFPDMVEHWRKLEAMLGKPLTVLSSGYTLDSLIEKYQMLPNHRSRFCTRILKIEPFIAFMAAAAPAVSYVGLRADEEARQGAIYGNIEGIEQRFPLRERGMGEQDVWDYLDVRGICIPPRTDCEKCFFQRLEEWRDFLKRDPVGFARAVQLEKMTGHTFRSPQRDTWPAPLIDLAKEFASGRKIRGEDKEDSRKCRACRL
jgi:3'-phosphoadenosine 5'-phosphosulfate sulfotransferase (PAPS reductase)/FAD synthetase